MKTAIIKIGNSKGVRIPKVLLEESGLTGAVELKVVKGGIRITPIKSTSKVAEKVLARDWLRPEEDEAWAHLQKENQPLKLILGSQSKNRQEVLRRAGITFEIMPADIDEKAIRSDDYEKLPLLLARAKADALALKVREPALLVTADTVTIYKGELREKPETPQEAREFLETYSGADSIKVITGVTVTNTATGKRAEGVHTVLLDISELPQALIDELVNDPVTLTVAGAFTVCDKRLEQYIAVQAGGLDSSAGLPLDLLLQLIAEVTD